jgi:hypothetical protein
MEKFKETLSFSARDVYCSAVCDRLTFAKVLSFNIADTAAIGLNVLHMKKSGQTSKSIVPRKG